MRWLDFTNYLTLILQTALHFDYHSQILRKSEINFRIIKIAVTLYI
jgi:hypothetical protein